MTAAKRDFDSEAVTWDENHDRIRRADEIVGAILKRIVLSTDMDIMDFGCGTGLLSMRLLPFVRTVVGVDSSAGMLEVFKKKIAAEGLNGITGRLINIDMGDMLTGRYDMIVSGMTLHHVKDIRPLFNQFYSIISPGGYCCIADLDPDEGRFHADRTGVFHSGFDRNALWNIFSETGFEDIIATTATEINKPDRNGVMKRFTVFLMSGVKQPRQNEPSRSPFK